MQCLSPERTEKIGQFDWHARHRLFLFCREQSFEPCIDVALRIAVRPFFESGMLQRPFPDRHHARFFAFRGNGIPRNFVQILTAQVFQVFVHKSFRFFCCQSGESRSQS